MKIKYRILSIDSAEHSIIVRYYTDVLTEDMLATEFEPDQSQTIKRLPSGVPTRCRTDYNYNIWNVDSTKEEIETMIMNNAPVAWLDLQHQILNPQVDTTLNIISDLVGKEVEFERAVEKEEIEVLLKEIV